MAFAAARHLQALGVPRPRQGWLAVRRRLAGEAPLPLPPSPAPVNPATLGIVPDRAERVVVQVGETGAVFDGLAVAMRRVAAVLAAPPVTFGAAAGVELGRGLDAEQACWARQLLERLGSLPDLAGPAARLDPEARLHLVLARTLARRSPWTLLEDPLQPVPAGRRRRLAELIAASVDGRGLVVVTAQSGTAAWFGARETRPEGGAH